MLHLLRVVQLRRPARRRTYLSIILAALALLATVLASCSNGGSTRPGGYLCTAPQNQYGCYTFVTFSHSHINSDSNPDIVGDPVGAASDMLVVPVTCDLKCQVSSGSGNSPGYISNFIQLYQYSTGYYLRIGYKATWDGATYYFSCWMPGVNNGQPVEWLLATVNTGGGANGYQYASAYIGLRTFEVFNSYTEWVVYLQPPFGASLIGVSLGQSTFHPDYVFYGQAIYGTSGATALLSTFANNNIYTSPLSLGHPTEVLTEDGVPPGTVQTVDHPSDAGWLIKPTMSSSGGMFYVSCC
jgi:hypothetical protein